MTDREAFLRAIVADPDDDTARLIFADWLDENGEPDRAEFVRVQCEVARLLAAPCPACEQIDHAARPCAHCPRDRRHPLRRRERDLLDRHWHPWSFPEATYCVNPSVPAAPYPGAVGVRFGRGFVAEVRLSLASFLGGACEGCRGERGRVGRDYQEFSGSYERWEACPVCSGTGRTPGLVGRLGQLPGLERVTLADREPYQNGQGWAWFRAGRSRPGPTVPAAAELPAELWGRLTFHFAGRSRYRAYASPGRARAALSDACISLARLTPAPGTAPSA